MPLPLLKLDPETDSGLFFFFPISQRFPLNLAPPTSLFFPCSTNCKHSYSKAAIIDLINSKEKRCPVSGCMKEVTKSSIKENKSLNKQVQQHKRRMEAKEESRRATQNAGAAIIDWGEIKPLIDSESCHFSSMWVSFSGVFSSGRLFTFSLSTSPRDYSILLSLSLSRLNLYSSPMFLFHFSNWLLRFLRCCLIDDLSASGKNVCF